MNTLAENLKKKTSGLILGGIQLEQTALSYPVPAIRNGRRADCFFLFVNVAHAMRSRPFAALTLDAEDGKILEYTDCRVSDFAKDSGIALNQQVNYAAAEKIGVRKLMEQKKEFASLYEEVRRFAFCETLTKEQKDLLHRYLACEKVLVGSEVSVFYQLLSPEFDRWKDCAAKGIDSKMQ